MISEIARERGATRPTIYRIKKFREYSHVDCLSHILIKINGKIVENRGNFLDVY